MEKDKNVVIVATLLCLIVAIAIIVFVEYQIQEAFK